MDYLTKAREYFKGDYFATEAAGATIEAADINYAKCRMDIERKHKNAMDVVMGGAIYTLADFTFAVAANTGKEQMTVTLTADITYKKPAKGSFLTSEAEYIRSEGKKQFFEISVKDDSDVEVARVAVLGYTVGQE